MLAVEPQLRENFLHFQYALDTLSTDDMEFIAQPQFQPHPEWFSAPDHLDIKPQMTRTTSSNSVFGNGDFAPGLSHSNGSIRSGSSSTVGSPYSGPHIAYTHDDQFFYGSMSNTGIDMTAIANNETYNLNEYGTENSLQSLEKLNGSFVGESSADLSSSQHRSTAFRLPISQSQTMSISPAVLFNDPMVVDTRLSPPPNAIIHTPRSHHSSPQRNSASPHTFQDPVIFKSPSTPASAYPKTPAPTSSPQRRQKSPEARLPAYPMHSPNGPFQNHFFAQSSGNFMPPIESSCRFSSLSPALA